MGLRDVLAKMKLIELDPAPHPVAPPPSRGPAPSPGKPAAAAPAKAPAAPAPPAPAAPASPAARPAAPTASQTIEEILASLPKEAPPLDEAVLRAAPASADGIAEFPAIYKAAGIAAPPHGFTAPKILEMLASPQLAGLEPRARAAALAGFLEMNPAGRVSIRDVIEDAVRRDQALDAYEVSLARGLQARASAAEKQNAELQAEIDDLVRRNQERMRQNLEHVEAERSRIAAWQALKADEERRLFDAIAPFVETNPVSVGGVSDAPPPARS